MTVSPPAVQSLHLVVCVHGFVGSPQDLKYLSRALLNAGGPNSFLLGQQPGHGHQVDIESHQSNDDHNSSESIVVLNSGANVGRTFDGIDICAFNLLNEIHDQVIALRASNTHGFPNHISKFSFIGHSLGGLIARFALGLLQHHRFFDHVPQDHISHIKDQSARLALAEPPRPCTFATFATPHLGIPPDSRTGWTWLERRSAASLGRTGIQLYLFDDDWKQPQSDPMTSSARTMGILEAMVQPKSAFMSGLNRFPRIVSYANATYDYPVAFRTSALFIADPFAAHGLKIEMNPKYAGIITSYSLPPRPATRLQRILRKVSLPSVLNPRRMPLPFPFNYLALLIVPPLGVVLGPLILTYVFLSFHVSAYKSNIRVRKQVRKMRLEAQQGRTLDEQPQKGADDEWYAQTRAKLLDSPRKEHSSGSETSSEARLHTASPQELSKFISPLITQACPKYPLPAELPKGQRSLTAAQLRIIALWMSKLGPKFERFFVKVEDVLDAHPLIVVRREENSADIRGKSIVQHFIDHFIRGSP